MITRALGPADLADNQAIGAHAKRLPDQIPEGHFADALNIGRSGDQTDQMRMLRGQFGGVFDTDYALVRIDRTEHGGKQSRFPGSRSAGHQERQPSLDDAAQQRCRQPSGRSQPLAE